jgi:hypothetical protein
MSTDNDNIELTAAQRRYIATRADRVGIDAIKFLEGLVPSADEEGVLQTTPGAPSRESALDAARQFGLVAASSDDPSDLATNPDHMEGFGQDADNANPC